MNALDLTLLYLLAAVLGVVGCRMLKLPPMLGYLAVGVLIGPNALALAQNSQGLRYLAEFGVVFLMFVIGLEFSLPKLRAMKRHVFGLGFSQVVLTVLITTAASLLLGLALPRWWNVSWQIAVALGGVMAMSSTAIVIKLMAERLELESEHGKRVVGILLFQDLAVVPLLVLIPALGAFVAGMLIAETEYKHQVETDIRPFHDVLLGLFFITIGMMLDWRILFERWPLVLLLFTLSIGFKLGLITLLARAFGAPMGVALRTGLYLGQAGEFGLVLLSLAGQHQLVPPQLFNPILASMVLSMMATPFVIMYTNDIVTRVVGSDWLMQSVQMTTIARKAINTDKHVIICGYGRCGQNLARLLEREGIPYMALDLDPDRVRQAAAAGHSVVFGDAARLQALMAAGLHRASALVVTYLDTPSALKVLHHAHEHAPQVPVVVRTVDDADLDKLRTAGATEVVPEAIEASLMLASHALALVGVPMRRVIRVVQDQRDARYNLLRGYFHGADDDHADEIDHERLDTVTVPTGGRSVGLSLQTLALEGLGVRVVSLRRATGRNEAPAPETVLHGGDTLVIGGKAPDLALAEERLLMG
ncbi:cation:proton antiporter [Hydrogenophaga bisanensis]|uniref:Cation:proton antiporter n=1 Tax=Hydrogenophaga bisanensis TaxID=439611 RepID=A0ABW2RB54_9BURK